MKNSFEQVKASFDKFQQQNRFLSFGYGIIKKYSDDESSKQSALLTYYGFLSLFPLLLVLTTLGQLLLQNDPVTKIEISQSINNYFPVVGQQLQNNIHSLRQSGFGLLVGLIASIYGARGVTTALRSALNNIWHVTRDKQLGFIPSLISSMQVMVIGGGALIISTILAGVASDVGKGPLFKAVSLVLSLLGLWGVLLLVFKLSIDRRLGWRQLWRGALVAALCMQLLQFVGGYVITHQLRNFSDLYGTFAIVLGLLFWIYLMAQVILYAAQIDAVRDMQLWPRSLQPKPQTAADKKAHAMYYTADWHYSKKVTAKNDS